MYLFIQEQINAEPVTEAGGGVTASSNVRVLECDRQLLSSDSQKVISQQCTNQYTGMRLLVLKLLLVSGLAFSYHVLSYQNSMKTG